MIQNNQIFTETVLSRTKKWCEAVVDNASYTINFPQRSTHPQIRYTPQRIWTSRWGDLHRAATSDSRSFRPPLGVAGSLAGGDNTAPLPGNYRNKWWMCRWRHKKHVEFPVAKVIAFLNSGLLNANFNYNTAPNKNPILLINKKLKVLHFLNCLFKMFQNMFYTFILKSSFIKNIDSIKIWFIPNKDNKNSICINFNTITKKKWHFNDYLTNGTNNCF